MEGTSGSCLVQLLCLSRTDKGIEKNALARSAVAYHLATFGSRLYWSSSLSGTAALSSGVTSFRPQQSTVILHSPLDFHTSLLGLLKGELVLLITPWIFSQQMILWMGIREFQLVQYSCQCNIVVPVGTCCSSTLSSPTTEGSSKRPGKVDSCLISFVSTAATPKAHQYPFGSLKYVLLR